MVSQVLGGEGKEVGASPGWSPEKWVVRAEGKPWREVTFVWENALEACIHFPSFDLDYR